MSEGITPEMRVEALALIEELRWEPGAKACVVTLDLTSGRTVLNAVGPFDTPEQALVIAAGMDREDAEQFAADPEFGKWEHVVVPWTQP